MVKMWNWLLCWSERIACITVRLADLSSKPYPVLCPSSATQIELLQLLVQIASENNLGEGVIVKIKFNIIASLYDYNPNLATYMKVRTTEEYGVMLVGGAHEKIPRVLTFGAHNSLAC